MAISTTKAQRRDQQSAPSNGGRKQDSGGGPAKSSHVITESVDVGVAHGVAYDQWTQYEKWSEIFKKESAKAKSSGGRNGGRSRRDSAVQVTAKIGPSRRQWDTEIVERNPGRRIAWKAKGGVHAEGVTTFHELDRRLTRVMVDIEYRPSGFVETVGNFLRMPRRRVRKDLKLFKNYVELRGSSTGRGPGRIRGSGLREDVDRRTRGEHEEQEEDR